MRKYLLMRGLRSILTIVGIFVFVFIATRLTGNPAEIMFPDGLTNDKLKQFNAEFGLDQPIHIQLLKYAENTFKGNFGVSIITKEKVISIYQRGFTKTLKLGAAALIVSVVLGGLIGVYTAVRKNTWQVKCLNLLLNVGYAVPNFIIALYMVLFFSYWLKVLPSIAGNSWNSYVMPVIALSAHPTASIARYLRTSIREVMLQDYIRTAVAKGIGTYNVIYRHAIRNALIPVITVVGLMMVSIMGGSVVVESVYSIQGIGKILADSVFRRDYPMVQFGVTLFACLVVIMNFLIDISYSIIDPRIRIEK